MSKRPFTVMFDANPLIANRAGIGHYTARLIEHLAAGEPDVQFVGYYYNFAGRKRQPSSPQAPNIRYRPILAVPGPAVNLLRRFGLELPIEILTGRRADFILYPNFLGQPSLFRTPSAAVVHDLMYYDHPEYGSDKNVRDLKRFVPRTLRRVSFVITVSDFSRQRLMDIYQLPSGKILTTFIPPRPPAQLSAERQKTLLAEQGIDKSYLFFIGTLEPRKNLPALLSAYTQLPVDLRRVYSLLLAGKMDWKYQETKTMLDRLQAEGYDIRYLGYVDNDSEAALYSHARLVVLPSHYEGFGMQITDALGYGTACAVSDIPVFHEAGGNAVAYFDQNNPASMARTIAACLSEPPAAGSLRKQLAGKPDWPAVSRMLMERIKQASRRNAA